MEVDVHIDRLTDCLVERKTGNIVETEYFERSVRISPNEYKGWKFDWSIPEREGYTIYQLYLKDDDIVQGRIALRIDGGIAEVNIVENAPHNYGNQGKYEGVGAHLFAIACKCSLAAGCDGVVAFTVKSSLVEHYQKTLNAILIRNQRMFIDEYAANVLIKTYLER